mgnify:CR=1 FL=1
MDRAHRALPRGRHDGQGVVLVQQGRGIQPLQRDGPLPQGGPGSLPAQIERGVELDKGGAAACRTPWPSCRLGLRNHASPQRCGRRRHCEPVLHARRHMHIEETAGHAHKHPEAGLDRGGRLRARLDGRRAGALATRLRDRRGDTDGVRGNVHQGKKKPVVGVYRPTMKSKQRRLPSKLYSDRRDAIVCRLLV